MYSWIIKDRNLSWVSVLHQSKQLVKPSCADQASSRLAIHAMAGASCFSHGTFVKRNPLELYSSRGPSQQYSSVSLHPWISTYWKKGWLRAYSSGADGRNTSEGKQTPVKDGASFGNEKKSHQEVVRADSRHTDGHTRIGEQDQKEWLRNEKIAMENKKKDFPFMSRRERFRNEVLRRIVPWEKIHVSWDNFPYYINENNKNILVECVASHLKNKKYTASHGARLLSSSGRILLQSVPGTELYRERIVRALARDLQVPLLVLDSSVLAPYDFGDDCSSEGEDDNAESAEESSLESEDDADATNEEEWTSSGEAKSDSSDDEAVDVEAAAEAALKKLIPGHLEVFEQRVSGESESSSESSKSENAETFDTSKRPLKRGDRVKYIGPSLSSETDDRPLSSGQRGEVYEVSGDQVAIILDTADDHKASEGQRDEKLSSQVAEQRVRWLNVKDVEHDPDAEVEDFYIAMEVLCEVLDSMKPLIVYFPDSSLWLSRAVRKSNHNEFVSKVKGMFDQLSGPIVMICGQNKIETGSKEKEKFTMILPGFGRLGKLPLSLKHLTEGLKATKRSNNNEIYKLFTNVLCFNPPKEEDLVITFNKQIEEDRRIVISRSNLNELHKVLDENAMSCIDLLHVNNEGVILTKTKAEKVVGLAKNHYLSSCMEPYVKGDRLFLPRESLEIAITRLKEQEDVSRKPSQTLKSLAKDEYETNFVSAVVPPGEIGVMFDDIGALEEVKKALNELVILPMQRPELFAQGNLLRPCKGLLLFGPPGTGKTLLAKALATEAGANFISITGSTLTSKWFGDAEKLTKALFSFASKLAPVIIFVDEVDSLLGARGGAFEHEATRRMRNEFMAAWDGLRSKDSQRILILGATNRPFDLDDAVIRRLPRRIYVDLPDSENRMKILRVILKHENLIAGFKFDELANATEGYSGSDLKNLCISAAYIPVEELLEKETEGGQRYTAAPELRPLTLDDFIKSKTKVGPSVSFDAASMNELRKWNEQYGEGGSRRRSPFGF